MDPDAVKDRRQEEKRITEDEMIGWHRRLSGHNLSKLWEMVKDREAWHVAVHKVTRNCTHFSDSTAITTATEG